MVSSYGKSAASAFRSFCLLTTFCLPLPAHFDIKKLQTLNFCTLTRDVDHSHLCCKLRLCARALTCSKPPRTTYVHQFTHPPSFKKSKYAVNRLDPKVRLSSTSLMTSASLSQNTLFKTLETISQDLRKENLSLLWVGVGRNSFYHALASQLKEYGLAPSLNKYFAADEKDFTNISHIPPQIQYPQAAKEARLEVLRYIASNADKLQNGQGGLKADSELFAATQRFAVRMTVYDIQSDALNHTKITFEPTVAKSKAHMIFVRRGQLWFSSSMSDPIVSSGLFANCNESFVQETLQASAQQLGFSDDDVMQLTLSNLDAEGRLCDTGSNETEMINKQIQLECDSELEALGDVEYQDLFMALAKQLQVNEVSTSIPGTLSLTQSSRLLRSEIVTLAAVHQRFSNMPSPSRELAAAAYKYKVEIITFAVKNGTVERNLYVPADGVNPKATLFLGNSELHFWAVLPKQRAYEFNGLWNNFTQRSSRRTSAQNPQNNIRLVSSASTPSSWGTSNESMNVSSSSIKKSVYFDPSSLSWKLGEPPPSAKVAVNARKADPLAMKFLPRFRQKAEHENAAVTEQSSEQMGLDGRAANGVLSDDSQNYGVERLKDTLTAKNLQLDEEESGCNMFLALARTLHRAKVQIPGIMLTQFESSSESALIGAMSRKARTDTKTYVQDNMHIFDKPGQWLGDHDLLAAARLYKVQIHLYMVIYNKDVKIHLYEPEKGVASQASLHICLHKNLFWPIVSVYEETQTDFEAISNKAEPQILLPAERKRASALDKILDRYGSAPSSRQDVTDNVSTPVSSRLDKERSWMAGQDFGETVVINSKEQCSAALIFVHGLGASGSDFQDLADAFQMPWVRFVFPTASRQAVSILNDVTSSWFDITAGSFTAQNQARSTNFETCYKIYGMLSDDSKVMSQGIAHLKQLIQAEVSAGLPRDRIAVIGFSQGGGAALALALELDGPVGVTIALSPFLPAHIFKQLEAKNHVKAPAQLDTNAEGPGLSTQIHVIHGSDDKVTPLQFGKPLYEHLNTRGYAVQVEAVPGLGHELSLAHLESAKRILMQKLPVRHDAATHSGGNASKSRSVKNTSSLQTDGKPAPAKNFDAFVQKWTDPAGKIWSSQLNQRFTSKKQRP